MSSLWRVSKIRIGGFLAAGGVLVGLMMFIVLPAIASTAGQPVPPPSTQGVMPIDVNTGGQSNDCAVFGSTAANQFRIANPKSQTYSTSVNGAPVTFTLKLNPDYARVCRHTPTRSTWTSARQARRSSTSASRAETTRPITATRGCRRGYTTADGALHAPAQATLADGTPTTLYSISNLTFCFDVRGSVSGTVYQDLNQNGTNDDSSPQSGWTVNLYQGIDAGQDHHVWFRRLVYVRVAAGDGLAVHRLRGAAFGEPGPRLSRRRRAPMSARRPVSW